MNSPEEMIAKLDAVSLYQDRAYGRLDTLFHSEDEYERDFGRFKGLIALSNAFKAICIETIELLNLNRPQIKEPLAAEYALLLPRVYQGFKTLCGAERIARKGYPLEGYVLLRNVFDNSVLTAAALQRITSFYSIEGVTPGKPVELAGVRKLRKDTEFAVRRSMTGEESGLSEQAKSDLTKLDQLFDYETHGARLSLTEAMDWMRGKVPFSVLPKFEESAFAMFANRFSEVS